MREKDVAMMKKKIVISTLTLLMVTGIVWSILYPPSRGENSGGQGTGPASAMSAPKKIDIPQEITFGWDKRLSLRYYETFVYDDDGNQIGEYRYDSEGELNYYKEMSYDAYGNCTRETYDYLLAGGEATSHTYEYEYDGQNRVTRKVTYADDALSYVSDYRYAGEKTVCSTSFVDDEAVSSGYASVRNADGTELLYYSYDANGEKERYQTAECDASGRMIRQTLGTGDGDGEPFKELVTAWDDENYVSVETLYEPAGHINAVQYNTYTADWNQLSGVRYLSGYGGYDASDWNEQMQFTEGYWADYDGERKLWEFRYSYQEIDYYRMFLYDDAGNCVTEVEYDNDNDMHAASVYRCRYDETGRLLERYTYRIRSDISFTGENGGETSLEFDENGHIAAITRLTGEHETEHQYLFDEEGRLTGQYLWQLGKFRKTDPSVALPDEEVPVEN